MIKRNNDSIFSNKHFDWLVMKKLSMMIIILCIASVSGCAYYNTFFNARKYFNDAENERKKREENIKKQGQISDQLSNKPSVNEIKNYDKSIEKASKVLEIYPKSKYIDDALFLLGQCFFRKEDYNKAKRKFLELIENFQTSAFVGDAQLWMGKTNIELRDYEAAEKNFHDILNSKAKDEIRDEAQLLLGGLFKHKGDYFTAINEYGTAAKRAKEKSVRANALYEMGECYYRLKNFAKAVESFKQARRFSPNAKFEFNAMSRAGLALKDMEKYDEAIKIFTNLLGDVVNDENWPMCRLEIAHCHRLTGEFTNAIGWYLDITTQHPKTEEAATAYFYLGKIYQEQKTEYQFAKEYYDKAVSEYPRAGINAEANAMSKSIQRLLALKADILAQHQKIAKGDSIAAEMDSLEINTPKFSTSQQSSIDTLNADSSLVVPDTLDAPADSLYRDDENSDLRRRNLPGNRNQLSPKQDQKVVVKTGELGTPKEELIKDKLLLGEIYLFEFNQPDSALKEYIDVLEMDTSRKVIPKTLFTIGFICETFKKDTSLADSVYQRLISLYPDDPLARQARKKIKTIKVKDLETPIAEKFQQAEQAYLTDQNYTEALNHFESIYQNYPQSDFAPKALLTMGWIYENGIQQSEKAFETYQQLLEKYPASVYAKRVKPKVEEVKKARASTDATKNAVAAEGTESSEDNEVRTTTADTTQLADMMTMDKEKFRRLIRQEMEKNDPRRKTPKRW